MKTLYTLGYTGAKPEDLEALAHAGMLILDTRIKPVSRFQPVWNKKSLAERLGDGYLHEGRFGNRNYKGGPVEIVDLEGGLETLGAELERRPVVLLCTCKLETQCHRSVIADAASRRWPGLQVIHLHPGEELRRLSGARGAGFPQLTPL